jgi:hypothetical protein
MIYLHVYALSLPALIFTLAILALQSNGHLDNGTNNNGWSMSDRFSGIRFEIHLKKSSSVPSPTKKDNDTMKKMIQSKADQLACFGWVQDSPKGTLVGEARCNKNMGLKLKRFLYGEEKKSGGIMSGTGTKSTSSKNKNMMEKEKSRWNGFDFKSLIDHVIIKDYEDTKIKLHFSHFKILDSRRETCFRDEPHMCENNLVDLL